MKTAWLERALLIAFAVAANGCSKPPVRTDVAVKQPAVQLAADAAPSLPNGPTDAAVDAARADPAINAKFKDPKLNVDEWVKGFEGESREVYAQRARIVEAVGVQPGQSVADIGAGTGLFTRLFAHAVGGKGRVFAVDVSPVFLRHIEAQAKREGLRQVITVAGTDVSTGLQPRSVDRIFICDTYHHFEDPPAMLASISRALRGGGEVIVVDFKRDEQSSQWTRTHVRAGEAEVVREWASAGFEVVRREDFLKDNYLLVFKRAR